MTRTPYLMADEAAASDLRVRLADTTVKVLGGSDAITEAIADVNADVYVNAMGGIRLNEPSTDLALCIALASAASDTPIDKYTAAFGEVGLTGEIRAVTCADKRVNECIKTGFKRVLLPAKNMKSCEKYANEIELVPIRYLGEAIKTLHLRPTQTDA